MTQVRADSQGASAAKTATAPVLRPRPLSPHLQVWRWHVTMAASIATRVSGSALYVGALIAAGWALSLAAGRDAYDRYTSLLGSPLGLVVLFGLTTAILYHLAAGLRHFGWDLGQGTLPRTANASAWAAFAFGLFGAIAVFALYFLGAR